MSEPKPTCLLLGGLAEGYGRALLTYLVPPAPAEPLVSHLRLVDKHLCQHSSKLYTVYMDKESRRALAAPNVEYIQGNLQSEETLKKIFVLPEAYGGPSKPYDFVFDFSGEPDFDAAEPVHIERSAKLIPLVGKAAAEAGVKAYIRKMSVTYKSKSKKPIAENEGMPWGVRAKWIHEGIRALAAMPNLNLVVARPALLYGPYVTTGYTPRLITGEVYRYLGEQMDHLWSADNRLHTIHSHDYGAALLALARWMAPLGRAAAEAQAGEPIPSSLDSKDPVPTGCLPRDRAVTAPLFNIVDEGDTTQGRMAEITGAVLGIKTGFHSSVINQFAKLNLSDVIEDANEKHLEPWPDMLARSNPPILDTPLTPHVPADLFSKNNIGLQGAKLSRVTGWKPKFPAMTREAVQDQLDKFKEEGIWPNAPPLKRK